MKIIDLKGYGLSSPTIDATYLGYLNNSKLKNIGIIEIHTDQNIIGFGETYSGVYCAELIEPSINFLKKFLIGETIDNPEKISTIIRSIPYVGRNGLISSISSAINIAIYDAIGKKKGLPVYKLFSKEEKAIDVYASNGSCTFSPDQIVDDVKSILDLGHNAYKMRVGFQDWATDLERIEAAKNILGNEKPLMIDSIMGTINPPWSTAVAKKKLETLKDFDLYWIEEPVHPSNVEGMSELNLLFPIAGGEALSGIAEFDQYLEKNCVSYIQPDVSHSGGFDVCMKVAEKWPKTAAHVWGSGLAVLANLHFALASNIHILEIPMMSLAITEEIIRENIEVINGKIKPPIIPGIGIEITDEIKEKYKLKRDSNYRI